MSDFFTDAILLRKIEYGDHDYIITFLTRSRGKISVIAKNAKKSVRRFSGALDLFSVNHIQCTFPKKNKEGLTILAQTDLENGFANIRYDVFKTTYACYWVELVYLWLEEGKKQTRLYDLLYFVLAMLDRSDIKMEVLSLLFQIRFMGLSGFSPNIESCENCNTLVDDIQEKSIQFDFKEGKIICYNCRKKKPGSGSGYGMPVSKGTLKQLFWISTADIQRADRIKSSLFAIKEGEILLESFIPFHIGREFKSLKFLRQLRQEQ
ncbi:MAG: DNA repair protein RecO [Desulfobacteraceae bacterium]|nr:DNA repair protein RecO [Desulfobacteraceae bacterium]